MRTLNDIIPPSRRKESGSPVQAGGERESLRLRERPPRFPYTTVIIIAVVIIVSFGALFYFSSAKVDVTPNSVSVEVQSTFTAGQSAGDLPFEVLTAQKIASQNVQGSGTKTVNTSASGTITIYNTQTASQKLITNTRFATAAGLIFRIHAPVTIPGGSQAKPGSITAKIYADQPGSTYNVGPTSFTIPGFAGTALASKVYAQSTTLMTGGASGTVPVIEAALEKQTRDALETALAPDLLKSIQEQIPAGYTLLPGATVTTFQELASEPSSTTGTVDVKEQGTITAVVFPNVALAEAIASSIGGLGYQNEPLTLAPNSSLALTPDTDGLPDAGESTASFSFKLNGTASLIYTVDPVRISAAVSGKTRSAAEVALTNYPEVKRAVLILRPFWRKSFPEDPASIKVSVVNP